MNTIGVHLVYVLPQFFQVNYSSRRTRCTWVGRFSQMLSRSRKKIKSFERIMVSDEDNGEKKHTIKIV